MGLRLLILLATPAPSATGKIMDVFKPSPPSSPISTHSNHSESNTPSPVVTSQSLDSISPSRNQIIDHHPDWHPLDCHENRVDSSKKNPSPPPSPQPPPPKPRTTPTKTVASSSETRTSKSALSFKRQSPQKTRIIPRHLAVAVAKKRLRHRETRLGTRRSTFLESRP